LEARARSDKKRVPVLITTILTFLDNHYPDLEGDEARRGIWLVDVPLAQTHSLRSLINTGKRFQDDVLEKYDIPIVASALKLYLLELPGTSIHMCSRYLTNYVQILSFLRMYMRSSRQSTALLLPMLPKRRVFRFCSPRLVNCA
jgi:hypothetical protein